MKKSLCLLIKNENKYLKEWIDWHLNQGFNHFYIYNTGKENPQDILNQFDLSFFTIVNWHNKYCLNMQIEAYQHCIQNHKNDDWIGFIDIDEFIYLPSPQYLDSIDNSISVLILQQQLFNANGLIDYEDKPVQKRFTQQCNPIESFKTYKSIIRPRQICLMGVHKPLYYKGQILQNTNCYYNHYYTKSLEEWEEKITRGSCDPRVRKKYSSFFLYNPDLISYKHHEEKFQNYSSQQIL